MHSAIRAQVKVKHELKGKGSIANVDLWLHEYHTIPGALFKEAVGSIFPLLQVGGTYLIENAEVGDAFNSPGKLEVKFHARTKVSVLAAPPAAPVPRPKPAAIVYERTGTADTRWLYGCSR